MADTHRDDIDLATAAEQSSEEDEFQEGNSLAADEASVESAEHSAIHVEDDNEEEGDLAGLLEALDAAMDPEADAIVDDALDLDSVDEADASVAAAEDEADIEAVYFRRVTAGHPRQGVGHGIEHGQHLSLRGGLRNQAL